MCQSEEGSRNTTLVAADLAADGTAGTTATLGKLRDLPAKVLSCGVGSTHFLLLRHGGKDTVDLALDIGGAWNVVAADALAPLFAGDFAQQVRLGCDASGLTMTALKESLQVVRCNAAGCVTKPSPPTLPGDVAVPLSDAVLLIRHVDVKGSFLGPSGRATAARLARFDRQGAQWSVVLDPAGDLLAQTIATTSTADGAIVVIMSSHGPVAFRADAKAAFSPLRADAGGAASAPSANAK